jgi:hypothetical protein
VVQGQYLGVLADPSIDRVYYLHGSSTPRLSVFSTSNHDLLESSYPADLYESHFNRLARWGADGLAFRSPSFIYLIRRESIPLRLGADADGDEMPDQWERSHGLNPNLRADADEDPDGDGWTNLAEARAGTDPHKPDRVLVAAKLSSKETSGVLGWIAETDVRYQIETTSSLVQASWTAVGGVVVGQGAPVEWLVPISRDTAAFFRLRCVP